MYDWDCNGIVQFVVPWLLIHHANFKLGELTVYLNGREQLHSALDTWPRCLRILCPNNLQLYLAYARYCSEFSSGTWTISFYNVCTPFHNFKFCNHHTHPPPSEKAPTAQLQNILHTYTHIVENKTEFFHTEDNNMPAISSLGSNKLLYTGQSNVNLDNFIRI